MSLDQEKYLYTIQLPKRKLAEDRYITVVDTTVKTGLYCFGPTWELVLGVKRGTITEEQYRERYIRILRRTWKTHRLEWENVLDLQYMALGCYCKAGMFCHRHIVKEALTRVLEQRHFTVVDGGEITS